MGRPVRSCGSGDRYVEYGVEGESLLVEDGVGVAVVLGDDFFEQDRPAELRANGR